MQILQVWCTYKSSIKQKCYVPCTFTFFFILILFEKLHFSIKQNGIFLSKSLFKNYSHFVISLEVDILKFVDFYSNFINCLLFLVKITMKILRTLISVDFGNNWGHPDHKLVKICKFEIKRIEFRLEIFSWLDLADLFMLEFVLK